MIDKAEKLQVYLENQSIGRFEVQEQGDQQQSVVFRSMVSLEQNLLPVGIIVDATLFTIVRVKLIENRLDDRNILEAYRCITTANCRNKIAKYYMTPDMTIFADACIPAEKGAFSPKLVVDMLHLMLQDVQQELPAFIDILQ